MAIPYTFATGGVIYASQINSNFGAVALTNLSNTNAASLTSAGGGTFTFNTTGTITVPSTTDTLVGRATTDTLTNKTLSTGSTWSGNVIGISSGGTGQTTAGAALTALGGISVSSANIFTAVQKVNLNAASPPAVITGTLLQLVQANTVAAGLLVDSFAANPSINLRRADGTGAAPSAVQSGESIAALNAYGYGATGYSAARRGSINWAASENWTDTAQGTAVTITGTTAGGTSAYTFTIPTSSGTAMLNDFSNASGAITIAAGGTGLTTTPANGQLLIGNGVGYTLSTLTAGSGVTITNAAGSITLTASGTAGVGTFSAGTTGFTPNTATAGTVTLAGTLNVANGGTGVTASTGASSVVLRDANQNITTNYLFAGYSNVAAAGTTTTLTASSVFNYTVTGSGGQTFKLPDATTLAVGSTYIFNNNQSSGTIIAQNNSSTTIVTLQSGSIAYVTLLTNSIAAGTWDTHYELPSNVSWSTNTLTWTGTIASGTTWNGNVISVLYGGTGAATLTGYVKGSGTSALTASATIPNTDISGLGTISTQAANSVAITGGAINSTTVGATTASTGAFTTLSASSTVSGTGFSTYLASPPAIGGSAAAAGTFTTLTATTNINSTRINPRIGTTTGAAAGITPTGDTSDQYNVTAAGVNLTINAPSGTPVNGQKLTLRIVDNGTARTLTWTVTSGAYRVVGTTLPTTTVANKTIYVGCIYNAEAIFWDVVAVTQQA